MPRKNKRINPVAKFAQQLQRCQTLVDRKKRLRSGYRKHKKAEVFQLPPFALLAPRLCVTLTC